MMDKFIFNDDSQIVKEPIIDTYTQSKEKVESNSRDYKQFEDVLKQ